MATKTTEGVAISIPRPDIRVIELTLIGETRLVLHRWSEKARQEMRDKQGGKARTKKAPKIPQKEFEDSLYTSREGWCGFPAGGFKKSAVGACRYTDGITMVVARGVMHVLADGEDARDGTELVRIHGSDPRMREDMVRINMGTADLRYRGEFLPWWATIRVKFNANIITEEQLVNLFTLAGLHVGLGEGRPGAPKNTMDWGMFRVATADDVLAEAA